MASALRRGAPSGALLLLALAALLQANLIHAQLQAPNAPDASVFNAPPIPSIANSACPAGYYVVGTTGCTSCPRNTYSTSAGSTSCTACPPGTGAPLAATVTSAAECNIAFKTGLTINVQETFTIKPNLTASAVTTTPRSLTITSGQPVVPPAALNSGLTDYVVYALNNGSWLIEATVVTQSTVASYTSMRNTPKLDDFVTYTTAAGLSNTLTLKATSAAALQSLSVLMAVVLAVLSMAVSHTVL